MCQHKFIGSLLHTIFQANGAQTEQNSSIDKMKHLFICVAVIVSTYFLSLR